MKRILLMLTLSLLVGHAAMAKVKVAASLPDLASIASYIGGDRIEAFSIARNTADPHSVEVLPTYMVKVSHADIYLKVGLALDQWADQIIDGARNSAVRVMDCSRGIAVLEKPVGKVDASMGDVHPDGNPHYWLDPDNGVVIAQNIAEVLTAADPGGATDYAANLEKFKSDLVQRQTAWKAAAAAIPNRNIITYHSSWVYFAHAFDFNIVARIEPVPGIPPTGSHLAELLNIIRENNVKIALQEPYFSEDAANYLARQTPVKVLKLPPSCNGVDATSYFDHFQQIFDALKTVS
ncbi:MAG TPA: metal ABC transporter substrate-binding protein [bacterium]|jgi:zinc/manganese transport system substrate-binding protein